MVKTEKIAIYGKGGIGKSTIASLLSSAYAKKGEKVLHVGCDPKQDSTITLMGEFITNTVLDLCLHKESINKKDIINKGRLNIDCIECGGPKAGVGCAGRGITRMFEILEELSLLKDYNISVFDVLGDVVCGGFAAPMREGFAQKVIIVVSEEMMSLYAANRIIEAINMYKHNGVYLGGLVLNYRDNSADTSHVERFAKLTNTNIICKVPRAEEIIECEKEYKNIISESPESHIAQIIYKLADDIENLNQKDLPPGKHIKELDFNSVLK